MKLKLKIKLLLPLLACVLLAKAQTNTYQFKRQITEVSTTWHSVKLPDDMYQKINLGFEDLRIFGINGKDTIEVPYLLKQRANQASLVEIPFKQLNQSAIGDIYYYTFQLTEANAINQISLDFRQENFDWKVNLEGSNDNQNWFGILKDYRILSIKNNETDYQFTKLSFPNSKYQFYRIAIKSNTQPTLTATKTTKVDTIKGIYEEVKYQTYLLKNDTENKKTVIEVGLKNAVPVSYLKLDAQSDFDFYRPIKIEYATDSIKTERGIEYHFATLYEGTISSLEAPEFNFTNTITSKLKITVSNHDNRPLRLSGLAIKGNSYDLIARFDDLKASYALYYGNEAVQSPNYEIEKFESKIPTNLTSVTVSQEQKNPSYTVKTEKPLFENKIWLWGIMAIIIALLGFFSFKMLKN
ncbi:DUF3999 family protein [Pedobacter sp. SL55]|uniref:DUF3999 family protein n=1 Tax=Pedobacter sp. SL55 TaxID=2995161 RepID=UPI0022707F64|nr:DUF3999 family protein [Pedobacter sp. SL55]WAC40358.1 DUF3999 family protein [Pedobacter sp. SL55]